MLGFLGKKAQRDQQGEGCVFVPSRFETPVKRTLHILPQGPTIRANDHCAAHGAIVGQFRLEHQRIVPLVKILFFGDEK
jgi:hypothetical protein